MNREKLLNKLTMLDFMATDLHLYLDTHPCDEEAINKYNETIKEANDVRCEYEDLFGSLCSFRSVSNEKRFNWIDSPWPWQKEFNYNIEEEC